LPVGYVTFHRVLVDYLLHGRNGSGQSRDNHMQEKLLTPFEAANVLSVSPATLAIWRSTGRYSLPFTKIGSLVRYRPSDLARFIASRSHDGGDNA
jgi:hypothetical protein